MKRGEAKRLVDAMTREIPRVVEQSDVPPDTCVLQARLAVEVGREAGLRMSYAPVKVRVFSPEALRRIEAGETPPGNVALVEQIDAWQEAGAVIRMIGYGSSEPVLADRWDGHVGALAEGRYFLDPSLGQLRYPGARPSAPTKAARPPIPDAGPVWFETTPGFRRGREAAQLPLSGGSMAEYVLTPGRRDFISGADDGHFKRDRRLARVLLERIRRAR